jgi:hypothetical protein
MSINLDLSGEGIAAMILAVAAFPAGNLITSIYSYRRQRALDKKLDAQQEALATVALNQAETHDKQVMALGKLGEMVATVASVQTNMQKVEINTNHMREALVEATRHAALLTGRDEGIAQEKARSSGEPVPAVTQPAPLPDPLKVTP